MTIARHHDEGQPGTVGRRFLLRCELDAAQPTLLTDFAPPSGSRSQRPKTVMGLGQPKTQAELQALVGALADEDESIRWLAGSSLARLGGLAVVNMLAAFLRSQPGATAEQEARRVLELIADTDENE